MSHFDLHKVYVDLQVFQGLSGVLFELLIEELHAFDVGSIIFIVEAEKTFEGRREVRTVLCFELLVGFTADGLFVQCDGDLRW